MKNSHRPWTASALTLSLVLHAAPALTLAWYARSSLTLESVHPPAGVISIRITPPEVADFKAPTQSNHARSKPPAPLTSSALASPPTQSGAENNTPVEPISQEIRAQALDLYARNLRTKIQSALQDRGTEPSVPARGAQLRVWINGQGLIEELKVEAIGEDSPKPANKKNDLWRTEITQAILSAAPFGVLPAGTPKVAFRIPIQPRRRFTK